MIRTALLALPFLALAPEAVRAQAVGDRIPLSPQAQRVDMTGDGTMEAVEILPAGCEIGTLCRWRLLDRIEGGTGRLVSEGEAHIIQIAPTADGGRSFLVADGVIWGWDGVDLFPWASLLDGIEPVEAHPRDGARLSAATGMSVGTAAIARWEADLIGEEEPEVILIGQDGSGPHWATGYAILDASGEVILKGVSMDIPRIFVHPLAPGRVATVIDVHPAGYVVHRIGEPRDLEEFSR